MSLAKTIGDGLPTVNQTNTLVQKNVESSRLQPFQETIYQFLLMIVKQWPAQDVLREFKHLFIYQVGCSNQDALNGLYQIILDKNEQEFRNTLKRCCYILVNNWDATRQHQPIQELIQLFADTENSQDTFSPTVDCVKSWLANFIKSKDYEDLKLFVAKHDSQGEWTHRYTSYLLVPQFIDLNNPVEQREAARARAKRLKDKFKFELAMYTAHSQSPIARDSQRKHPNPTGMGDEVLRLIKAIVAKRGPFSYANLANIFIKQTQNVSYQFFKESLSKYLIFSVANQSFVNVFQKSLSDKLESLYENYHQEIVNEALILRTCNRVIEYLTTENNRDPSPLFALLLSQGNPLTLVVIMLKVILISPNSRLHLELCIAALIKYYQKFPVTECHWVVTFLEVFNITFAIYAENVEYNLISMPQNDGAEEGQSLALDSYRIFSQLKWDVNSEIAQEQAKLEEIL